MSWEEFTRANQNAESAATLLYKTLGNGMPSITKLMSWLEKNFGIRITVDLCDLSEYSCAGLVIFDYTTNGCRIKIHKFDSWARQRFTICHEIAHIIRDNKLVFGFSRGSEFSEEGEERFCERFAAAFLMPTKLFIEKWNSTIESVHMKKARIAKHFKVSVDAVYYRAKELQLIA